MTVTHTNGRQDVDASGHLNVILRPESHIYQTWLKTLAKEKHSSLFVNDEEEMFYKVGAFIKYSF